MFSGLLVVGTALLVVLGALVTLALMVRRLGAGPSPARRLEGARRRQLAFHWAGVVLGGTAAGLLSGVDSLGRGLMLALPVGALVVLLSVVVGQLLLRPPAAEVRVASLTPRRMADYLPVRLATTVAIALTWLIGLLTVTTGVGSPDDLGRAGRSLTVHGIDAVSGFACASSSGPWPGSFYSLPILLVLLVGMTVSLLALRVATVRPQLSRDSSADDDALRRQAARTVVAAFGTLVAVPAVGVEVIAAAVLSYPDCAPAWWAPVGYGLKVTVLPTVMLLIWCLAQLLVPSGRPSAREERSTACAKARAGDGSGDG